MGGPAVETRTAVPARELRSLVGCYRAARYEGVEPGVHRGLPSRNLEFIICLGPPLRVATALTSGQPRRAYSALVAGLHLQPATVGHDGTMRNVSMELTPAGARALFGVPAAALAGQVVDLADLLGRTTAELTERLAAAGTWQAGVAVLDDVLTRCANHRVDPGDCAGYVWQRILATDGRIRVGELAEEAGYSRRQLGSRFRSEYGVTPKQAARIVRFERSRELVRQLERARRRTPRTSLADVAAQCGYHDQAHLARDWVDLAGCAPSAWLASEQLPFVQDTGGDAGAGS